MTNSNVKPDFKDKCNSVIDLIDDSLLDVPFGRTEPYCPMYFPHTNIPMPFPDREKEHAQVQESRDCYGDDPKPFGGNPYCIFSLSISLRVDGITYHPSGYKNTFMSLRSREAYELNFDDSDIQITEDDPLNDTNYRLKIHQRAHEIHEVFCEEVYSHDDSYLQNVDSKCFKSTAKNYFDTDSDWLD